MTRDLDRIVDSVTKSTVLSEIVFFKQTQILLQNNTSPINNNYKAAK